MTAQAHESPRSEWVEPKIGAIRRALPADQVAAFNAELEKADLDKVPAVITQWHGRAVGHANGVDEQLQEARAAGYTVPAGAVRLEDLASARNSR